MPSRTMFLVTVLMLWSLKALAVFVAPEDFREVVKNADSILEVEIEKSEVIKKDGKLCGIQYFSLVKNTHKGKPFNTYSFVASESLMTAASYVIVFSKDDLDVDKKRYSKTSGCPSENKNYIWFALGRRIFLIDEWMRRVLDRDQALLELGQSYFLKDPAFISPEGSPDIAKGRFEDSYFLSIDDMDKIIKSSQ